MAIVRHQGTLNSTGSRVFVVYREVPGEPDSCIVCYADSLPEMYVYKVRDLVMGRGQESEDLYKVMEKVHLERNNMLMELHTMGYLRKQKTNNVTMHVGGGATIGLSELNDKMRERNDNKIDSNTVSSFNPMDVPNLERPETSIVVQDLLSQAKHYEQLAQDTYDRIRNIDPSVIDDKKQSSDDDTFTLTLDKDITQTKAIEVLKLKLRELKHGK